MMTCFTLDPRLVGDTLFVTRLKICEVRLMNDSRWLWAILVPQVADIQEIHHLVPIEQTATFCDLMQVTKAIEGYAKPTKMNVGALGNIVRQLHIHVIARHEGDSNWPNPVWGYGKSLPYEEKKAKELINDLKKALA